MRRPSTKLAKRQRPLGLGDDLPSGIVPLGIVPASAGALVSSGPVQHVLVADGRHDVIADLSYHLARAGYRVSTALTGPEAMTALRLQPPTLALIGESLRGLRGGDVVQRLRATADGKDVAAVMLLDATDDAAAGADARVAALALGADDCLVWPGDVRELVLRVASVARRYARVRPQIDETLRLGTLIVDAGRAEVTVAGIVVHVTRTEFDFLWILVKHPGQLFTRDQLLALTRGNTALGASRRVDRHMTLLRAKLGVLGSRIETVMGKGYRFQPLPDDVLNEP